MNETEHYNFYSKFQTGNDLSRLVAHIQRLARRCARREQFDAAKTLMNFADELERVRNHGESIATLFHAAADDGKIYPSADDVARSARRHYAFEYIEADNKEEEARR